jgi:hypothetical protein
MTRLHFPPGFLQRTLRSMHAVETHCRQAVQTEMVDFRPSILIRDKRTGIRLSSPALSFPPVELPPRPRASYRSRCTSDGLRSTAPWPARMVALVVRGRRNGPLRDSSAALLISFSFPAQRSLFRDSFRPGEVGDAQLAASLQHLAALPSVVVSPTAGPTD